MPDFHRTDVSALLSDPTKVGEVRPDVIVPLLCQLGALQVALSARLLSVAEPARAAESAPESDRLLTAEEAATLLGVTPRWLYRHQRLPFVRKLSRKALRVSETGLRRWLAARKA
jgi:hypothetical protein